MSNIISVFILNMIAVVVIIPVFPGRFEEKQINKETASSRSSPEIGKKEAKEKVPALLIEAAACCYSVRVVIVAEVVRAVCGTERAEWREVCREPKHFAVDG